MRGGEGWCTAAARNSRGGRTWYSFSFPFCVSLSRSLPPPITFFQMAKISVPAGSIAALLLGETFDGNDIINLAQLFSLPTPEILKRDSAGLFTADRLRPSGDLVDSEYVFKIVVDFEGRKELENEYLRLKTQQRKRKGKKTSPPPPPLDPVPMTFLIFCPDAALKELFEMFIAGDMSTVKTCKIGEFRKKMMNQDDAVSDFFENKKNHDIFFANLFMYFLVLTVVEYSGSGSPRRFRQLPITQTVSILRYLKIWASEIMGISFYPDDDGRWAEIFPIEDGVGCQQDFDPLHLVMNMSEAPATFSVPESRTIRITQDFCEDCESGVSLSSSSSGVVPGGGGNKNSSISSEKTRGCHKCTVSLRDILIEFLDRMKNFSESGGNRYFKYLIRKVKDGGSDSD